MQKEERELVDYIVVCISEFASKYQMSMREAYFYLKKYEGIAFLKEFFEIEHTLSFKDVLDDLTLLCKKNGGTIA